MAKRLNVFRIGFAFSLTVLVLSCSDKDGSDPQPDKENLISATSAGSWSASDLKLLAQLAGRDIDINLIQYNVDIFKVVYTTHYQDMEIEASGLVLLPKATTAVPMFSFQRGTIVQQSDAPSLQGRQSEDVVSYSALASTGFITAVPDMIGFGESQEIFHPYYIEDATANAVVDLLRAAAVLAAEKGIEYDHRVLLAGYSQGGYSTLAAHKALEANPLPKFQVIASFPAAGGYDINGMLKYLAGIESYPDPYYLACVGLSYQSYYSEDQLLTDFFNEPYASRIPSLFNGTNSSGDIDSQLTTDIGTLIRDEILMGGESYAPYVFLEEKFAENSLLDWTPKAPVYFYHGDDDLVIPLQNSVDTYEKLLTNGADPATTKLIVLEGYNHGSGAVPYVEDIVKKLAGFR